MSKHDIGENPYTFTEFTASDANMRKDELQRLKAINKEMVNALIEIKEYWGGSSEGALDAIQHVNEIANWILSKVEEEINGTS